MDRGAGQNGVVEATYCRRRLCYSSGYPAAHAVLQTSTQIQPCTDEDRDILLDGIRVVRRVADEFHLVKLALEFLSGIVQHDRAIAGVAAWAPEEPSLVSAQRRRESELGTIPIDGTGRAVVLRENSTVRAPGRRKYGSRRQHARRQRHPRPAAWACNFLPVGTSHS